MRLLLACDRSGGHIFPALSLLPYLYNKYEVHIFIPSLYFKSICKEKDKSIRIWGIPFSFRNILIEGIFRFAEAVYITVKVKPHYVLGFGGRDSFFLLLWAKLLNRFVAIYEPNIKIGKANRLLTLFVNRIYRGINSHKIAPREKKGIGIPIRDDLKKEDKKNAKEKLGLDRELPVILFLGGSQGARFINQLACEIAKESEGNFQIIHITGLKEYCQLLSYYDKIRRNYCLFPFYRKMGIVYSATDVAVSRAGALTLAELSFYEIPTIFIPYPKGGRHQYDNALYLKKREAAELFTQKDFSWKDFKNSLYRMLNDRTYYAHLKDNLKKLHFWVKAKDFFQHLELDKLNDLRMKHIM